MRRLLNELLELSRIGRLVNPPSQTPLARIVEEALALTRGRLMAGNISVHVEEDLPVVHGDRPRLVEVMQNLIDNAAKFMGDQSAPHIEIGVRRGSDEPILFVRDNGIGIDPAHHEKVFGLFDKLDPRSEGTGVGLALAKRIVEVHGGRLWVESEGKGKGSMFCFTLPVKE
jgi:signal transduction histidine kinase